MKKEIIISILIGIIFTISTHFIQFGYYDTEIGPYYSNGFPFKTYRMLGDAGVGNNYAFLGNFFISTIIVFLIIFIIKKIRKCKI